MENQPMLELFVRLPDGEHTIAEIDERTTEILSMFLDTEDEGINRMLQYFRSEHRRRILYDASVGRG
jgi:hypothetical protein